MLRQDNRRACRIRNRRPSAWLCSRLYLALLASAHVLYDTLDMIEQKFTNRARLIGYVIGAATVAVATILKVLGH